MNTPTYSRLSEAESAEARSYELACMRRLLDGMKYGRTLSRLPVDMTYHDVARAIRRGVTTAQHVRTMYADPVVK